MTEKVTPEGESVIFVIRVDRASHGGVYFGYLDDEPVVR